MRLVVGIFVLGVVFTLFNPFHFINSVNSIHLINPTRAQDSKGQTDSTAAKPATDFTISSHPSQVLEVDPSDNYVIGQGDILEVFVWRNEPLSRQVVVRPDGRISLPLLQDLQAEGLTVLQLKDEITRRYGEYLNHPRVTVIVIEIKSFKVSVLGRVATPGVYPITGDTTLVEVISMAGGFTEWANKRKITVITHKGGKEKKIIINYKKIVSGKDPRQNIVLKRGDTIIVP